VSPDVHRGASADFVDATVEPGKINNETIGKSLTTPEVLTEQQQIPYEQQQQGESQSKQQHTVTNEDMEGDEYSYYYASYNGALVGRFGGCHPTCPEIIAENVEEYVIRQLDTEGLGKTVIDRPTVLETVNNIIMQPTHFIQGNESKAWSEAVAFVQRAGKEQVSNLSQSQENVVVVCTDEDEKAAFIFEGVDDDTPSVDESINASVKTNGPSTGNKVKSNRRATVALSSSDKLIGKESRNVSVKPPKTKESNGKARTGNTSPKGKRDQSTSSSNSNTKAFGEAATTFEASDDHSTNVATIKLLKESLKVRDVAIKNLEQELELLQKQLASKHERKLK